MNRSSDNLCAGLSYEQLEAISIPITQGRELYCRIAEKVRKEEWAQEKGKKEEWTQEKGKKEEWAQEKEKEEEKAQKKEMEKEQPEKQEAEPEQVQSKEVCLTERQSDNRQAEEQPGPKEEPKPRRVPLQEDKWKQLRAVYPHIAPFQDERDYLSIGPEDFVIFSQKYYALVNNSFLLHGYYNYRHLILTCMERRNETCYYIGVPGNFYDREKQVALMFGFESFECREEPAGAGDYGYYMMRVEI